MVGYHANYKNECEVFINDTSYLIISKDTDYLGTGMYFWAHKSNALYWKETKKNDKPAGIVSAEICFDRLLDLTDDEICNKLNELFEKLRRSTMPLGRKLDYLFEAFASKFNYTVIKCAEYKDKKQENDFLCNTAVTTKSVDIYCVKVCEAISERKWVLK